MSCSERRGYSTIEHTGFRPSFDVCGIWGGYQGEGAKTVIPSKAYAKLSCRLVPHQDHAKIGQMVVDYFQRVAPKTVKVKVESMHGGQGLCVSNRPSCLQSSRAWVRKKPLVKRPIAARRGGSIPIIATFEEVLV